MRLFVSLWNYLRYSSPKSLEAVLGEIDANGFGVELWPAVHSFDPYRPARHPSFPCAPGFTEIYDLCKPCYRAWLHEVMGSMASCWHGRAFEDNPKDFADFEAYQTEIDTASYLGSEAISVHYIGEELTTRGYTGGNREHVQRILEYGHRKNVSIALETLDFESLQQALHDFPRLGVCLDPACIRWNSPHSLQEFLQMAASRIQFLHLYDQRGEIGHLTPGCGEIPAEDWGYLVRYLRESDFDGPAVLEIRPPPEKAHQSPIEAALEARGFLEGLE